MKFPKIFSSCHVVMDGTWSSNKGDRVNGISSEPTPKTETSLSEKAFFAKIRPDKVFTAKMTFMSFF